MRVVVIFAPVANAAPLKQRIGAGRHSVLFAHHADYAAATVTEHPGQVMSAFERAPHYLLDARLINVAAPVRRPYSRRLDPTRMAPCRHPPSAWHPMVRPRSTARS